MKRDEIRRHNHAVYQVNYLFVEATPKEAPHEIVRAFKGRSSRILRQEFPHLLRLPSLWTHAYFCRTAGNVSAAVIEQYIKGQSS